MYEIFLSAVVNDDDVKAACDVLSGLCAMPPWYSLHHVLYFKGPPRATGLSSQKSLDKSARKDFPTWRELHQHLNRQSFILQARYEVFKEKDFVGPGVEDTQNGKDFNSQLGTLRWTDFPEPPNNRAWLTQRKKLEIWEQKNLPAIMSDNKHV
jgi:mediator of RNA polymerase II transcription subunit 18, fungi type